MQGVTDPDGNWRNRDGAPTKRDGILAYAAAHPGASHSAIAKALGVSRKTVIKWLKGDALEKYVESLANCGEEFGGQGDVEGSLAALLMASLACCAVLPLHAMI